MLQAVLILISKKADLVVISDHINMQSENPLRGVTDDFFWSPFSRYELSL
jgi:purine nucleoside phosphorylase